MKYLFWYFYLVVLVGLALVPIRNVEYPKEKSNKEVVQSKTAKPVSKIINHPNFNKIQFST